MSLQAACHIRQSAQRSHDGMADVNLMAAMKFTDMKDQVIHWCGRCGYPGEYNNDRAFNYSSLYIWDEVHRQANWSREDFKYCCAFDVIPFVLLDCSIWGKIHVLFKHILKLFFSHALTNYLTSYKSLMVLLACYSMCAEEMHLLSKRLRVCACQCHWLQDIKKKTGHTHSIV